MKKLIFISAAVLFWFVLIPGTNAQEDNSQTKSYVKIRTMKIINGDTVVTEKEYTGDGNMNINLEDTLERDGFSDLSFNMMPGSDTSFMNKFSDMENMFRGSEFNSNDFNFPEFNFNNDPKTIMKQFNFIGIDTMLNEMNNNDQLLQKFGEENLYEIDTLHKTDDPGLNPKISGKNENNRETVIHKNIIVQNNNSEKNTDYNASSFEVNLSMNPTEDLVNISFPLNSKNKTSISITNNKGTIVQNEVIGKASGMYTRQIDLKSLQKGSYSVVVKQGRRKVVKQFVVS